MRRSILMLALLLPPAALAGTGEAVVAMMVRNSPLAGFRYNDGKLVWNDMRTGDALALVREPDNPFDAAAIRLEWKGRKIGRASCRERVCLVV